MRLSDGPTILVLTYPGELLGYGMWSNGNTIFRNDLKSSKESIKGLSTNQALRLNELKRVDATVT